MRILIVYTSSHGDNPFVPTLKKALERCGAFVDWSTVRFWESCEFYDIVFFQWPEAIWDFSPVDEVRIEHLKNRIEYWKSKGAKIAYTRHNSMAHTDSSYAMRVLYQLVETSCNIMFHMGETSLHEYIAKCQVDKAQRHVVVPHHVAETINREIDKIEARKHLNIPIGGKVILCFGSFRSDEERYFVLEGFRKLRRKEKILLAPSLFPGRVFRRNPIGLLMNVLRRLPFLIRYGVFGSIFKTSRVAENELPYYFAAADAVLIQRLRILNSGNLPMGFYFGKVVIGPNVGDVGEILQKTKNPIFDPNDVASLTYAIEKALSGECELLGEHNQQFADMNWTSLGVGKKIYGAFKAVIG